MITRDDAVSFFAKRQELWTNRDPSALAHCHTEDGTVISPIFRAVHGRADILGSYRSILTTFPDWQYTAQQLLIDGDRVAEQFHVRATHGGEFMGLPGSGRKFDIQGVCLFEMRDGLIALERRIYDFTGLLIQLGILKSKPVS
jgi:steroid delta-isomerase-like uncharacterized protein